MSGLASGFGSLFSGGATSGFGGFLGTFGKIFSGFAQMQAAQQAAESQAAAYEASARAAEANARISEYNAKASRDAAKINANKERRKTQLRLGSAKAKYLASGISLEGSPTMVLTEEALQGSLDALNELHLGEIDAVNFLNKASLQRYDAQVSRMRAGAARDAGSIRSMTTLLGSF